MTEPKPKMPAADVHIVRVGELVFVSWSGEGKPPMTPAEADTVSLVLQGLTNREIARKRAVSERTVANQLASVFRKLGVSSRFEMKYRVRVAGK